MPADGECKYCAGEGFNFEGINPTDSQPKVCDHCGGTGKEPKMASVLKLEPLEKLPEEYFAMAAEGHKVEKQFNALVKVINAQSEVINLLLEDFEERKSNGSN